MLYPGIDTSNYTTSAAVYDSSNGGSIIQEKLLLPVKQGELGLRQSDAVFHHTIQLPQVVERLFAAAELSGAMGEIAAIGVSARPRDVEGSYMPCFTVGINSAKCIASALHVPCLEFSHQCGHIAAAVYSSGQFKLLNRSFIAFHVSGGTTEVLLCRPDEKKIISVQLLHSSLDLKAGQAVDRVGVMLGFQFPAGKYVDEAARQSDKRFKINIKLKEGNCSLSGVENKCRQMLESGESKEDICRFCIEYISATLEKMAQYAIGEQGEMPLLFSGGVMSNSIIRDRFEREYGAYFAKPEFSCDNAAGIAFLTALSSEKSAAATNN